MKLVLYWFPSSKEAWLDEVIKKYENKISHYFPFSVEALKTKKIAREDSKTKIKFESEMLLGKILPTDYVVALDEAGKQPDGSIHFSQKLMKVIGSGKKRVVFVIGGAYGLSPQVKEKAQWVLSFSKLTFSHQIVLPVILEQVYRAMTIEKNQPYHNK